MIFQILQQSTVDSEQTNVELHYPSVIEDHSMNEITDCLFRYNALVATLLSNKINDFPLTVALESFQSSMLHHLRQHCQRVSLVSCFEVTNPSLSL